MKFKNLKENFEILMSDDSELESESLEALKNGLLEKKAKYTHKLRKGPGPMKRDRLEEKLKDSQDMLKKVKAMLAEQKAN